jgi:6-phosphogluconolactonase (cycloisomerase 2 family)
MDTSSGSRIAGLYVAGYGFDVECGLYRFLYVDEHWAGELLTAVAELAALARHPWLPIIYGVSGGAGIVRAWDLSGDGARLVSESSTAGIEPCHVAIDVGGRMLVVANYESGSIAVWELTSDGALLGAPGVIELSGSSVTPDRQSGPRPHQLVFVNDSVCVVDLGADAVHIFTISPLRSGANALTAAKSVSVPAGTGPRNLVTLPHDRIAFTGELGSTVISGKLNGHPSNWRSSPSTKDARPISGPPRNFPGDIQRSPDGQLVYVANRGNDTIATFSVGEEAPQLVGELNSSVRWPQHLLLANNELFVAGRDSSNVVALSLLDGLPVESRALFECPGAAWLLPIYENRD